MFVTVRQMLDMLPQAGYKEGLGYTPRPPNSQNSQYHFKNEQERSAYAAWKVQHHRDDGFLKSFSGHNEVP
jgi:hypothetical protein